MYRIPKIIYYWLGLIILWLVSSIDTRAQWRILPLGDSITQGGGEFASYRYPLFFYLVDAGYDIEFVGVQQNVNGGDDGPGGSQPNSSVYPDYYTEFDRDHAGYWGWRTDQIINEISTIGSSTLPDIALIHLGTNDIGQNGSEGVTNALINITTLISELRTVNPDIIVLLAQLIPIGPNTGYFINEAQVPIFNQGLADLVPTLSSVQSSVLLVDQYSGFSLATQMQNDGLHPNLLGEQEMADIWFSSLIPIVTNTPPSGPTNPPPPSPGVLSFETVPLPDGELASGPGTVGGWVFAGGPGTFTGIYNPPDNTYPNSAGDSTPLGADGMNVAFLVNGSGITSTMSATLDFGTTLADDRIYRVQVAIGGSRLSTTEYIGRSFGGYQIELLGGETNLATQTDLFIPPIGAFQETTIEVSTVSLPEELLGSPLSIRISPTNPGPDTALDIDNIRLTEILVTNYTTWVTAWDLSGSDADLFADPDGDNIFNHFEFAFGLPPVVLPLGPAQHRIDRHLPQGTDAAGGRLQIVYPQRIATTFPGIFYDATFSENLESGSWVNDPSASTNANPDWRNLGAGHPHNRTNIYRTRSTIRQDRSDPGPVVIWNPKKVDEQRKELQPAIRKRNPRPT